MNKFLWNLFGIKDGDIPEDPTRRGFLRLLGGAAAVGVIQPTHFLAPAGGWPRNPDPWPQVAVKWVPYRQPKTISLSEYTEASYLIVPMLADNVFKPNPLFIRAVDYSEWPRMLSV